MIICTYSCGSASAYEYSTFPELLSQLPDNSGNLIEAVNVRNSVYTLWQRVSQVQTVASQSASASTIYTNLTPTPITVGGIPAGSTFSAKTMTEMWDALLYPYIAPSASLSGGGFREFGSSNAVTLNWIANKGSKNVSAIVVTTANPFPAISLTTINTSGNQSGTKSTTATTNIDTTFYMTVSDIPFGNSIISASTTVNWTNRRYWGTLSAPHPLLTVSSLPFSHSDVSSLSSELITGSVYAQTRSITTNFNYVVFIWPHNSVDLSTTPTRVNIAGLGNNNWIKTRSNVQFTNGTIGAYTGTNYDVWVFGNTLDGVQTQAPNTFTYVIS
jgi:hypothetical protein